MKPLDAVLERFRRHLLGRTVVQRMLGNSGWILADQVWRMLLSLITGVWVARYLGPLGYGQLNYGIALVAMIAPLATLGLTGILVRDFVRYPAADREVLGTAAILRCLAAVLTLCAIVAVVVAGGNSSGLAWMVLILGVGPLVQSLDIAEPWLHAANRFRDAALARTIATTLASLLKVGLIVLKAPVVFFAVAVVLETAFCVSGWLVSWRLSSVRSGPWTWSARRAKGWLRESWPVVVTGLAVQIQVQFDQVLIGAILEPRALGEYSAALRLVTALAFVPVLAQLVAAPEIARAKVLGQQLYFQRLHKLYCFMVLSGLVLAVPLLAFPRIIVNLLLGDEYAAAATMLPMLAFRLVLAGLGVARGLYLANESYFHYGMLSALVGAVVSAVLNITLIPRWGVYAAIWVSYLALIVTTFGCDVLLPSLRRNAVLMMRALVMPWKGLQR